MTVSQVVFIILSITALAGALGTVLHRNLFKSALFLVLSFVGVAGYYLLLEAELLAMVQILVYVGAIAILIIFAVMLTRRLMSDDYEARNEQWLYGLGAAILLFGILAYILLQIRWPAAPAEVPPETIVQLGVGLVSPDLYLLPFEVASILLLVALVGAVIIAREK
jgi:NADH:ubiquinone oxidoreductase subunit 6 (subunit J)